MEREAREARERASIASKARAARAARTARAGARKPRKRARREWQEPPDDRDSKPVGSRMPSLGRCAASPGGLSWERLGRIAFWSFSREPYRKGFTSYVSRVLESLETSAESMYVIGFSGLRFWPSKTTQNQPQNGSKMAPRRPPGAEAGF